MGFTDKQSREANVNRICSISTMLLILVLGAARLEAASLGLAFSGILDFSTAVIPGPPAVPYSGSITWDTDALPTNVVPNPDSKNYPLTSAAFFVDSTDYTSTIAFAGMLVCSPQGPSAPACADRDFFGFSLVLNSQIFVAPNVSFNGGRFTLWGFDSMFDSTEPPQNFGFLSSIQSSDASLSGSGGAGGTLTVTPLPEPGSLLLLIVGIGSLMFGKRGMARG
jgi:hypothetical protein